MSYFLDNKSIEPCHEKNEYLAISYEIKVVKEKGGKLACVDQDEQISEYREIDLEDLQKIIAHLENLGGEFSEYGTFRAVPHKAVLNALRRRGGDNFMKKEKPRG